MVTATGADVTMRRIPEKEGEAGIEKRGGSDSDGHNRVDQATADIRPQNSRERSTCTPEKSEVGVQVVQYETSPEIDAMRSVSFDTVSSFAVASMSDETVDDCTRVKERDDRSDSYIRGKDKAATGNSADGMDHETGPKQLHHEFGKDDGDYSVDGTSQITSPSDTDYKPRFEAGDHVIRWKLLKAIIYPIQIHGIVLSVEMIEGEVDDAGNPMIKVVIADFGYTKSQSYDEDGKNKKLKGLNMGNLNKMMNSYYNSQKMNDSKKTVNGVGADIQPNQGHATDRPDLDNTIPPEHETSGIDENSVDDEKLKQNSNGKRFRVVTLTEPKQIKKWSKINYGSLFASDGKLAKMKNWIMSKSMRKTHGDNNSDPVKDGQSSEAACMDDGLENIMSPTAVGSKEVPRGKKEANAQEKITAVVDENGHQSATLANLMVEANKIDSQSRRRSARRFSPRGRVADSTKNALHASLAKTKSNIKMLSKPWFGGSFRKEEKSYSLLSVGSDGVGTEGSAHKCSSPDSPSTESPAGERQKLPKSDPRQIVLARTKYILAQQDLPQSESTLPPYHVLYSNSECLAVWCKTGTFSTLQAAVFLHSTAVGNAKSTVALTAAIGATQPWLIPLVGIYGIVAIGMPYYLLKRCHIKWKEGEKALTDGFWSTADPVVFVAAIENWSGLDKIREF